MKKGLKRILALAIVLVMVTGLAAYSGELPKVTWRFSTQGDEYQVMGKETLWVAEQVAERTNGGFILETYLGGVLGNTSAVLDSVQGGLIQIAHCPANVVANYVPEIGFWALPHLITNWDDAIDLMASDLFDRFDSAYEEKGFYPLGFYIGGFSHVANNIRPITRREDLAGIKIRVMDNPMVIDIFNSFGAYAITMSVAEQATGLQQRTIDGIDQRVETIYNDYYEFLNYISLTSQSMYVGSVIANASAVKSLPAEYKAVLDEVCAESQARISRLFREEEGELLLQMQDKINYLTDEAMAEFAEFSRTQIWPKYEAQYGDIMKAIIGR